jgi:D-alanyl-D-alanine carboxypeptidase (penicillin-binding protein 5/6)
MSKIMTAYVVFDMLKQGRAKLDDELPVSERAWRTGGSKMFVPIGGRIKISDLLRGMVIQSGNDSCIVLAEGLAGSETAFVDIMNEKAKQIGLKDSHFANVDGLPSPEHWMTAHDLASLAIRTIEDFPSSIKSIRRRNSSSTTSPRQPQPAALQGYRRRRAEDRTHRGGWLQPDGLGPARQATDHLVIAGLPTMKARAQGKRAADRMGVPRVQQLQAGWRRRQDRGCRGMARQRAESRADGRQGLCRHAAAQVAQGYEGHARL